MTSTILAGLTEWLKGLPNIIPPVLFPTQWETIFNEIYKSLVLFWEHPFDFPILVGLSTGIGIALPYILYRNKSKKEAFRDNPFSPLASPKVYSMFAPGRTGDSSDHTSSSTSDPHPMENDIVREIDSYHSTRGGPLLDEREGSAQQSSGDYERLKRLEAECEQKETLYQYTRVKLEKKERECEHLKKNEEKLSGRLEELLKEYKSLVKKHSEVRQHIDSKEQKHISIYEKKIALLEKKIQRYQKDREKMQRTQQEVEKMRTSLKLLKTHISRKDEMITKYQNDNKRLKNSLQNQRDRVNEATHQIVKLSEEIVALRTENHRLKLNMTEFRKQIVDLEERTTDGIGENARLQKEISTLRRYSIPQHGPMTHRRYSELPRASPAVKEDTLEAEKLISMCDQLMTQIKHFSKTPAARAADISEDSDPKQQSFDFDEDSSVKPSDLQIPAEEAMESVETPAIQEEMAPEEAADSVASVTLA